MKTRAARAPASVEALAAEAESACRASLARRRCPDAWGRRERALMALARADEAESMRVRSWFVRWWHATPGAVPDGEA